MSDSLVFICFVWPVFLFFYQAIVLAEENFFKEKFEQQYDGYAAITNRWVPRFTGLAATMSQ